MLEAQIRRVAELMGGLCFFHDDDICQQSVLVILMRILPHTLDANAKGSVLVVTRF